MSTEAPPRAEARFYTAPPAQGWWRAQVLWRGPPAQRSYFVTELTDLRARKVHFDLSAPATAAAELDGRSQPAALISELSQDLVLYRWNPYTAAYAVMFRGAIGHSADDISDAGHRLSLQAADYRAMCNRCILYANQNFVGQDQALIVNNIMYPFSDQGAAPINRGINWGGVLNPDGTFNSGVTTGVNHSISYQGTELLMDEIDKLANTLTGFEWGCEPAATVNNAAAYVARMWIWYPHRGVTKNFLAQLPGNLATVGRTLDSTTFSNWVQYTGASGVAPAIVAGDVMNNPQNHSEGLWQVSQSAANVASSGDLTNIANFYLAFYSQLQPSYALTLLPGAAGGWGWQSDCWLGDTITVVVTSGRLNVNIQVRIVQIDFAINDEGTETITFTVARKTQNLADVLSGQQLQLNALNRR